MIQRRSAVGDAGMGGCAGGRASRLARLLGQEPVARESSPDGRDDQLLAQVVRLGDHVALALVHDPLEPLVALHLDPAGSARGIACRRQREVEVVSVHRGRCYWRGQSAVGATRAPSAPLVRCRSNHEDGRRWRGRVDGEDGEHGGSLDPARGHHRLGNRLPGRQRRHAGPAQDGTRAADQRRRRPRGPGVHHQRLPRGAGGAAHPRRRARRHYGRRRVFSIGLASFGIVSLLCGLAPTMEAEVVFRLAQGAAGALLVPGSLAIISANFQRRGARPRVRRVGIGDVSAGGPRTADRRDPGRHALVASGVPDQRAPGPGRPVRDAAPCSRVQEPRRRAARLARFDRDRARRRRHLASASSGARRRTGTTRRCSSRWASASSPPCCSRS